MKNRKCPRCGDSFTPKSKSQQICGEKHYMKCNFCKKDYPWKKRSRFCSEKCRLDYINSVRVKTLVCKYCGDEFVGYVTAKYCPKQHYSNCVNCDKKFPVAQERIHRPPKTCSTFCAASLSHTPEAEEIRKQNSLKRWGVEHPFQAKEIKEKIVNNERYQASLIGGEKFKTAIKEKYGVENVSSLEAIKEKKAKTFKENYVDKGIFTARGPVSKTNIRWREKLEKATGVKWEYEHYFSKVGSIDLYAEINGELIAVEINPTATHNSYFNLVSCSIHKCDAPCDKHALPKDYHYNRAKTLKELHNIPLISVFDWMDEDKIISYIRSKAKLDTHKIYAKQAKIVRMTQMDANRFFKEFHILGPSVNQDYCYGLVYEGHVVQVQSFYSLKNNSFEVNRLASRNDWAVIGGVNKLTKHFIRTVGPSQITAFCDLNLSCPDFDVTYNGVQNTSINSPQKCWSKRNKMVLDNTDAFYSASRLMRVGENFSESKYPKEWDDEQVFLAEQWLPVWDCGMTKKVWSKL